MASMSKADQTRWLREKAYKEGQEKNKLVEQQVAAAPAAPAKKKASKTAAKSKSKKKISRPRGKRT